MIFMGFWTCAWNHSSPFIPHSGEAEVVWERVRMRVLLIRFRQLLPLRCRFFISGVVNINLNVVVKWLFAAPLQASLGRRRSSPPTSGVCRVSNLHSHFAVAVVKPMLSAQV